MSARDNAGIKAQHVYQTRPKLTDTVKELNDESQSPTETTKAEGSANDIVCPVCGAATVQEKCKVICRSDLCRGRVIYNCAEF